MIAPLGVGEGLKSLGMLTEKVSLVFDGVPECLGVRWIHVAFGQIVLLRDRHEGPKCDTRG